MTSLGNLELRRSREGGEAKRLHEKMHYAKTSLSGGHLILPERLGNGLSGTGGLLVSESVSLTEDCDRSGTATSVDGTPCTEDEPNSLFRSLEISSAVSAC
ncbi:hypothetical protein TNCV_1627581 [Trichonephila clavipes]|nr:hypothetical protein TNCV_1627581 [Trichonephila clavipes]